MAAPPTSELVGLFGALGATVFHVALPSLEVTLVGTLEGSFWERIPERHRAEVVALFRAVAADGVERSVEHPSVVMGRGDGWSKTTVRPTASRDGLLGAMLDLTTSHYNERQWRELEGWLATLGEALPFDFWICDAEGRFVLQNPASVRRIGSALGRTGDALDLSPDERRRWDDSFRRAVQGESVREELETGTGATRRACVRVVSPVHDGEGVRAVLGVDLDVTELKAVEERLRTSLSDLKDAQDTLVRQHRLAALGEMSAVVAHEVRNPLAAISNSLALLRGQADAAGGTGGLLRIINDEVERLDRLVANLLEFARPLRPRLSPESLEAVVDEALETALFPAPTTAPIHVHRAFDPSLPPLPMDGQLLRVALTNVFRNAVQAMPGGGELRVVTEREVGEDGEWARLSIHDSGRGIPPEVRERIFEPFVTSRSTGHGLGLTIVRRVVEEHRGRVELTSQLSGGTTCVVRLPFPEPKP